MMKPAFRVSASAAFLLAAIVLSGSVSAPPGADSAAFGAAVSGAVRGRAVILDLGTRNAANRAEVSALTNSFDILGLPYAVTADVSEAVDGAVIYAAGGLDNATLSAREREALYSFVEDGGSLVAAGTVGSDFLTLLGIKAPVDSKTRFRVAFEPRRIDPALAYIDRPEERTVPLGNPKFYREIMWTHAFDVRDATVLAKTEDGLGILSVNAYGGGLAYYAGVSWSDVLLLPRLGNDYEAQRSWANAFEPGSDVFMLVLKAIFEASPGPRVFLSNVPYGRRTALLLSHDVDAQTSFANSVAYAELEKRFGVAATYFVTTKYFKDSQDIGYYGPVNVAWLAKVRELGGDIGSHSVAHSRGFDKFPYGVAGVTRAAYDPFAPTVLGELAVSRELLRRDLPGAAVASFRAGELRFPPRLVEAQEAAGYSVDSSFSSGDIMCNFAYRAFRYRRVDSEESTIVELPVTFDDSQGMLRADNVDVMVAVWLDIILANADNGAISTLLIHPDVAGYKLAAEERLLTAMKGVDAWIGDISSYGAFWNRRSRLRIDPSYEGTLCVVGLSGGEWPVDVAILVAADPAHPGVKVLDAEGRDLPIAVARRGDWLVVTRK